MEEWERQLKILLNKKARYISFRDPNVINRRIYGYPGGESEYHGFRSVILYFQLSTKIDTDVLEKTVRYICRYHTTHSPQSPKIMTLFLNNENFGLIYPKSVVNNVGAALNLVRDYYSRHAAASEPFSHILRQLFPPTDIYSRARYPSKEDLCIIFHDSKSITIDPTILPKIQRLRKNWIWICVERGIPVSISEEIIENPLLDMANAGPDSDQSLKLPANALPDDLYIYIRTSGPWYGDERIEITASGEGRSQTTNAVFMGDGIHTIFPCENFNVSADRLQELWQTLKKLGVFNLKSRYHEEMIDGEDCALIVKGGGKSIEVVGEGKYPPRWEEIQRAIKSVVK